MTRIHPVTLEVVRNALYAIAEEMSVIVMRSARSPLLKEAGDLSPALTDAEGRLIAQGRDIPIHMGVMGFTVKELLRRVPPERFQDGDVRGPRRRRGRHRVEGRRRRECGDAGDLWRELKITATWKAALRLTPGEDLDGAHQHRRERPPRAHG